MSNGGILNVAKAGQSIPLKWRSEALEVELAMLEATLPQVPASPHSEPMAVADDEVTDGCTWSARRPRRIRQSTFGRGTSSRFDSETGLDLAPDAPWTVVESRFDSMSELNRDDDRAYCVHFWICLEHDPTFARS